MSGEAHTKNRKTCPSNGSTSSIMNGETYASTGDPSTTNGETCTTDGDALAATRLTSAVKSVDILDSILGLCTESWACPLCAEKGISAKVQLLQATENRAIYFCETTDCLYPHNDDDEPVIVKRSLEELPADAAFLENLGFPPSLIKEKDLTLKKVCDLFLIKYAYNQMDDWLKVEKELAKQQILLDKEFAFQKNLKNIRINNKCSPIGQLRDIPDDLIKYVKHFIPNVEELVELLKQDML